MSSDDEGQLALIPAPSGVLTRGSSLDKYKPSGNYVDLKEDSMDIVLPHVTQIIPFDMGQLKHSVQVHTIETEIDVLMDASSTFNHKVKFDTAKKKAEELANLCKHKVEQRQILHEKIGKAIVAKDLTGETSDSLQTGCFLTNLVVYDMVLVRQMEEFVKISKEIKILSTTLPAQHLRRNFWFVALHNKDFEMFAKKQEKKRAKMGDGY